MERTCCSTQFFFSTAGEVGGNPSQAISVKDIPLMHTTTRLVMVFVPFPRAVYIY